MRILRLSGAIWVFLLLVVFCAGAADSIGKVESMEGVVVGVMADGRTVEMAIHSPVYLHQRVLTRENAKVQIRFNDDSAVFQGERSELLIDEYLYTPGEKAKNNCAVEFVRGMFRVITGRIVDLNSERFRVRTRMATIGIRGCELGFVLYGKSEDIYMLRIPEGKEILVEALNAGGVDLDRVMNVIREGVCVSVFDGTGLLSRPLTIQEAVQLIQESTPPGGASSMTELAGALSPSRQEIMDASVESSLAVAANIILNSTGESDRQPLLQGPSAPPPSQLDPTEPVPSKLVAQGGGPMNPDWYWGIYEDGSMATYGNPVHTTDYQSLIVSAVPYNLVSPTDGPGAGQAGANIRHNGANVLVTGSCDLNVQLNVTPGVTRWQGTFVMGNGAGDSLGFTIPLGNGVIDSQGRLTIPVFNGTSQTSTYNLKVNGVSFGRESITGERVMGELVGPGVGTRPITGGQGSFTFEHGRAAAVNGVFGADLN